ncbi:MAG: metal-dependent transcriptional regulator [Gemmatimonadales bacterium]|nr:metal-dependent transcriptional regulator [Gemmatimonadales bacterium]
MPQVGARPALSRSVEDYLKAIYRLALQASPVATSDIAQALDLSAPSVSGMVKRLSEQGLLEHVPYKGVELTDRGRRAALGMLRRHRILETYLVEKLGFTWDSVHPEAERLEHAASESLIERMALTLGNPAFDPHGDPIPQADGSVAEVESMPLTEIPPNSTVEILRVVTSEPKRLRYLAEFGLTPGSILYLVDRQPFHGPVTVRVGRKDRVLGHEMAALVLCRPTDGDQIA